MGIIQGGVIIEDGIPRPVSPFGKYRIVPSASTIQALVNDAVAGDTVLIEPGTYDEQVGITKSNITLVGIGGRGSVAIAPTAANPTALIVNGQAARREDVTLINLGLEGGGTGHGLHVQGDARRVRAYGSKIEGGNDPLLLESTVNGALADNLFKDCELAWADAAAVRFAVTGAGDPVTQTYFRECLFHNFAARGIHVDTVHTADLWVTDCVFGRLEAGTEPTDEYILASVASSSGFINGCRFATATNAAAVFALAAGVIWGANATEAGWSTARPV